MAQQHFPPHYQPSDDFINQIKRLPCQPSQSITSSRRSRMSMTLSQQQGQKAIEQFTRQIQARFQISIANKFYNFPKKGNNVDVYISSDEQDDSDDNNIHKDNYQQCSSQMHSYLKPKLAKQQYQFNETDRNFKKSQQKSSKKTQSRKKSKNSKTSQRKKQVQSFRYDKSDRQAYNYNQSKRLKTQPNSINYLETIKLKIKKKI